MNSDEILAELDAQYQELIQSVQLEGLSENIDANSEISGQKSVDSFSKSNLQSVSQIIKKYEQTLQTSREFYENEIKKLEDTKRKTESKYIESKKQIKHFENRIAKISENHQSQITALTDKKNAEIKELNSEIKQITESHNLINTEHAKCLTKLQKENSEITAKFQETETKLKELQIKCDGQTELCSKQKTDIEKYKLEIVQTRNSFDEQLKELQTQLQECRDEINFLCTTNEDLCAANEKLNTKLEKYPQFNSLLNSVILEDDKSDIQPFKLKENTEEKESKKHLSNPSENASSFSCSIFNLQDNTIKKSDTTQFSPELKTSAMFMIDNIEDNKIKEEMQRISFEERINKYEMRIQRLQNELQSQKVISNDIQIKEGQMQMTENEFTNVSKENEELKQQKLESENRINELLVLNEENQNKITNLNNDLQKLRISTENEMKDFDKMKEHCLEIKQLNMALDILKNENTQMRNDIAMQQSNSQKMTELRQMNSKLESTVTDSESSLKRLNERYDKLHKEYMALQTQFHETKLRYNESINREEECKQSMHKMSVNNNFANQELEQCKSEQINLRQTNAKQTEQISELNHEIKQMFRDLEHSRMQSIQSQQLISTLEKQLCSQTQQFQQTRAQLQMQMQMNIQNLNVMSNLRNNIESEKSDFGNRNTNSAQTQKRKPQTFSSISRPQMKEHTQTAVPNNIMNLARGKPFLNRQGSIKGHNSHSKKEKLSEAVQQRQKLESALFKLPTNPRSLEQRKKKHALEYQIREIESMIETIKKS